MKKILGATALGGMIFLQACGPAATPEQQAQRQHEISCVAGSLGGALIGGAIGNQFGGGSGQDILTASGAAAGAVAGKRYSC
ncbi:MAG: glycine zipper 2TM domain-containing protein [Pseudomonadota bacterium]